MIAALALSATLGAKAMDGDGLITIQSRYTAKTVMPFDLTAVSSRRMVSFAV